VPTGLGCHDATGGIAGGQIGYRWQATNWVFGVEAQGDWADLKGSNTSAIGTFGGLPFLNQTKIDSIGLFHRPSRLCLEQRALVREGRRGPYSRQI
jgi:outer membrane immunogenic protein